VRGEADAGRFNAILARTVIRAPASGQAVELCARHRKRLRLLSRKGRG
jgi:hypothetical protein